MPLHPHTQKKLIQYDIKSNIAFTKPIDYLSMLSLLNECEMVITDSGGLQKRIIFCKKKCIILRNKTEWVELINSGVSILSDASSLNENYKNFSKINLDFSEEIFGDGKASKRIVDSIVSFYK